MIDESPRPMIELTIDDRPVQVPAGSTLLDAARLAGPDVPVLCYSDHTHANGLCRLCVVEVDGRRGLLAACVTEAQAGMVVHTRSPNVVRARRTILEMLDASVDLSESPELQALLHEYEAEPARFVAAELRQPPLIDDNPFYVRDYAKCVLCWRCVQVCAEDAQFTFALDFGQRGFHTQIDTFFGRPMTETTCVFCGQCVGTCPTGALRGKREFLLAQGVPAGEVLALTRRRKDKKKG